MEKVYPVDSVGMPIRVEELHLRRSQLRERPENQSVHHYNWSARRYGRLLISQTMRDLEHEQVTMQNDQHNLGRTALHYIYDMPQIPTLHQMMDRLDIAKQTDEHMRIRADGRWVLQHISDIHWKQIDQEYNREAD